MTMTKTNTSVASDTPPYSSHQAASSSKHTAALPSQFLSLSLSLPQGLDQLAFACHRIGSPLSAGDLVLSQPWWRVGVMSVSVSEAVPLSRKFGQSLLVNSPRLGLGLGLGQEQEQRVRMLLVLVVANLVV